MISGRLAVAREGTGCLTKLVMKERMCFSPLMLFCSEEGPCNRCPSSNAPGSWFPHESGAKWQVRLHGGGYHRALQRRRSWASALAAGQPERAHDLLILTKARTAFPHAGEWEEKQQRALRAVLFSLTKRRKCLFVESPAACTSSSTSCSGMSQASCCSVTPVQFCPLSSDGQGARPNLFVISPPLFSRHELKVHTGMFCVLHYKSFPRHHVPAFLRLR